MKAPSLLVSLIVATSLGSCSSAKNVDCLAAERSLENPFNSWHDAHAYYERYRGRCADGALGEGLSMQFTQLLSKRWERLPELQQLANSDPQFLEWVLLGVYYDPEETESNASSAACGLVRRLRSCQPSEKSLCERLIERVGPNNEYIRGCGA
jgi:hypothetical protein